MPDLPLVHRSRAVISRALGCAINVALCIVVASILAIALGLLFGQLQLRSTPRGEPQAGHMWAGATSPGAPDGGTAALPGAPNDEAIPRTRGIEPATTPDPAQEAAVGAPFPGLALGIGRRVQHRAERASGDSLARPAPTPRPSPRPAVAPSAARAGAAGGVRDGASPAATPQIDKQLQALPSDCRLPCYGIARVGPASYYDAGPGFYAALPGYIDGTVVSVVVCTFPNGQANCHTFPVVTSCGCERHTPAEKVVDLSPAAFQLFEPDLRRGLVKVQITVLR